MRCRGTDVTNSEMHYIELQNGIQKIIKGYIRIGFQHQGDKATVKETCFKIFYIFYYALFLLSLITGAIASDSKHESMFFVDIAILCFVFLLRLFYIICRQTEINKLLNRICVHSIRDEDDFNIVNIKLKSFMKWSTYFIFYVIVVASSDALVLPFIGSEKTIFPKIGFPLDYENDDLAFWIAFLFICSHMFLSAIINPFSIIIWYLLFNCALKYKVLGSEMERLGAVGAVATVDAAFTKKKISEVEKEDAFNRSLISVLKCHKDIKEHVQQLESFLFSLLSFQLATSAFRICISVYSLAFHNSESITESHIYFFLFFYNIFDIFMVMYFANEIKLSSGGIAYCLFKSNWMERSQSCKKSIIIFSELLKQTQQLVVLKLYPLTLETFTKILNAAYSMFNILKSVT